MSGMDLIGAERAREHERVLTQWKHEFQWNIESLKWAVGFANITIKSLLLANGGALITLFAFIGSAKEKDTLLYVLKPSMEAFLLGTFISILVSGLAYVAQWCFTYKRNKVGIGCQIISLITAIISWLCFGLGAYCAAESIN